MESAVQNEVDKCKKLKPLSPHSQMDEDRAKALLAELSKIYVNLAVLRSALAASHFPLMAGSIVYENSQGRIPVTEMCNISADILMGHSNADQCATVRRLMDVLNDDTKVSELATQLSEEPW